MEDEVLKLFEAAHYPKKGLEASGQTIPMADVVISTRGKVMEQTNTGNASRK